MKPWLLVAGLFAFALVGCSKKEAEVATDGYVYEPVRIAETYIALTEKPDANRALLVGDEAKALTNYLSHAGVKPCLTAGGRFDIMIVDCGEMTSNSCAKATKLLTENGVFVWLLNVKGLKVADVKTRFESFGLGEAHLWMPGEERWVLVGRKAPRKVKLAAMLEVFTREKAFPDLAKARCGTLPEIFASYVDDLRFVMPAFEGLNPQFIARPELFVAKEIQPIGWIATEGVDADIVKGISEEIRSMLVVRRLVHEGNMLTGNVKDKKGEEAAIDKWAKAILRNPNELFVLERLDRLERNAKGFLSVGKLLMAMKCYETMVLIRPNDATQVHNFGMCLKKLGKLDLAEKVLKRAKILEERAH